jgi:hypothetical protein
MANCEQDITNIILCNIGRWSKELVDVSLKASQKEICGDFKSADEYLKKAKDISNDIFSVNNGCVVNTAILDYTCDVVPQDCPVGINNMAITTSNTNCNIFIIK